MSRVGTRIALLAAFCMLVGCTEPGALGDACVTTDDCDEGLSCFEHEGAERSPVCMLDCDLASTRLCSDGTVCTPAYASSGASRELGVCYLGGATEVGASCTNGLECVAGSICVMFDDGTQTCLRACRTDDGSECGENETCEPLERMGNNGYCQGAEL